MSRLSRIEIARSDILATFDGNPRRVYSLPQLATILTEHRSFWRLSTRTLGADFVRFLEHRGRLRTVQLTSERLRGITRYTWGPASPFEVALSLPGPGAYLSHGTAVFLHGLTDAVPSTVYVNREQKEKGRPANASLDPQRVKWAFARPQRITARVYRSDDVRYVLLNGKHTGRLEVGPVPGPEGEQLEATKLERTLIDITVRPAYAGGVMSVLEAYRSARDRMSVGTLLATLKALDYLYPYHQAIGFYMARAGYEDARLARVAKLGADIDFYLTHGAVDLEYDERWRLFHPRGI